MEALLARRMGAAWSDWNGGEEAWIGLRLRNKASGGGMSCSGGGASCNDVGGSVEDDVDVVSGSGVVAGVVAVVVEEAHGGLTP